MDIIAHIENDFTEKFGIPRQSGIIPQFESRIVFEPHFRKPEALRGLEDFSHIWIIWDFSKCHSSNKNTWKSTVRPPLLGGNKRVGVFATRSPFRPNNIGLSCVKIKGIDLNTPNGPIITVLGADLMNGTPIYDIKPYLPYTDCITDATGGFTDEIKTEKSYNVVIPEKLKDKLNEAQINNLTSILQNDPRPRYQHDEGRIYGFIFAGLNLHFNVCKNTIMVIED